MQCSEICGVYHAFMPISVEAVSVQDYLTWIDSYTITPLQMLTTVLVIKPLNYMWVTGFTDAEGSFIFSIQKRGKSNNWLIRASFEIGTHSKDIKILEDLCLIIPALKILWCR